MVVELRSLNPYESPRASRSPVQSFMSLNLYHGFPRRHPRGWTALDYSLCET